eukprot:5802918-Amphidinium_carterae.1
MDTAHVEGKVLQPERQTWNKPTACDIPERSERSNNVSSAISARHHQESCAGRQQQTRPG